MASRVEEVLADIERGGTTCEEEGSKEFVSRGEKASIRRHTGALSSHHNVMISGESYIDPDEHNFYKASDNIGGQRVELLIERDSGGEKSRDLAACLEKRNNSSGKPYLKKTSKPPRPPKGPTLSPADLKLVKELSEPAARKRERIEHMKAFRKMKESKLPSLSSNLIALVISIFFLVIILQGVLSRDNDDREFPGSPAPAIAGEGLISIHLFSYGPFACRGRRRTEIEGWALAEHSEAAMVRRRRKRLVMGQGLGAGDWLEEERLGMGRSIELSKSRRELGLGKAETERPEAENTEKALGFSFRSNCRRLEGNQGYQG